MTSASIPPSLEPLIAIQHAVERTSHFLAAGVAIFFYDYALTFSEELLYVWKSPFSIVKTLFLFNRYATPILLIVLCIGASGFTATGIKTCQTIIFAGGVAMVCLFSACNWLIAIRVHALYDIVPRMKWFLGIYWLLTAGICMGLTIHQMMNITREAITIKDLKVCTPGQKLPEDYYCIWIPSICYETTMFGMTMFKLLQMKRFSTTGLRRLLIRDGLIYYVVITAARTANLVLFIRGDSSTIYEALFFTIGLGSTLVSRMVLNLRSWNRRSEHYGNDMGWRFDSMSGNPSGEVHTLVDLASYRSRQHALSGGTDLSAHIDAPVHGPRRHYRGKSDEPDVLSPHHIVIHTETEIIAEEGDEYLSPSENADEFQQRSVWFANTYQKPKLPRDQRKGDWLDM